MRKKIEKTDFKYNFKIYLSLLSKYKFQFSILLLIILILEGARILTNYLFKLLIDNGSVYVSGSINRTDFISFLIWLAFAYGGVYLLRIFLPWIRVHMLNRVDAGIMTDLKQKFFNHIIVLDHRFHTKHKTGSLISRVMRGGGAIERMNDIIAFNFAPLLFIVVIAGISLAYFDVISAIITISSMVLFVLYSLWINHIKQDAQLKRNRASDREKANLADMFTNIESIKYFGKENKVKRKFLTLINKTKRAMIKDWDYYRWLDSGQNLILAISTFFVIYFPIMKFLEGEITIGSLSFIYLTFGSIFGNVYGFVHGIRGFYRSMADFEDLFQYNKVEKDIIDKDNAKFLKINRGEIEFRNVSFRYKDRKILNNFNLLIPKNKKVAFVGSSGAGKSTIIRLLYRLYDVDSGEILIDGQNIKNVKQESLRSGLSIVPQEAILFNDSIYNNIAFSRSNSTNQEVKQAIKFAQLDKLISVMPKGDKTIVGERGIKLSGGEKQRVSIARAILANKKILILDEATSSLDSETEHEIQKDLEKLMEGRTSIIIAHRLSTIMKADTIVVIDKGTISQIGTHKQLIKKQGIYRKLWGLQKGGYIK